MEKLKAGVIGCGRMGAFTTDSVRNHAPSCWFPLSHIEAILAHSELILHAISDSNTTILKKAGLTYKPESLYSDALEMCDKKDLDLVCIATRAKGRMDLIQRVIDSGVKAVHTEKPLCNSTRELKTAKKLFQSNNIFVSFGAIRRYMPIYQYAKQLADSGVYGKLKEIRVCFGSASLYWAHTHSIDLILFAGGNRIVNGIQANLQEIRHGNSKNEIENDPKILSATIFFDDGVTGHITQALGCDMILSCEKAEITVRADGYSLELYSVKKGEKYPSYATLNTEYLETINGGTLLPITELVDCIKGKSNAISRNQKNKEDILLGHNIAFSMIQSHLERGKIIDPTVIESDLVVHAITDGKYA